MSKKISIIILILALCLPVFAAGGERSNYQKIYGVNDPVYTYITDLYVLEGLARPSTTGPWSGAELNAMLSVFDGASLTGASKTLYDKASEILGTDASSPVFKAALEVDEELYINTNSTSEYFLGRETGSADGRMRSRFSTSSQRSTLQTISTAISTCP